MIKIYNQRIKPLLFSSTSKDSSVLFVGVILATLSGFLLNILLTRNLSPANFGLYITALTFVQLISDISELGINTSTIAFLSSSKGNVKELIVKSSFILKLGVIVIVCIPLFFFSSFISQIIFKNQDMVIFVKIAPIAVLMLTLITWGQAVFQANRKFLKLMVLGSSVNLLRLAGLAVVILLGLHSPVIIFLIAQLVLVISLLYLAWEFRKHRLFFGRQLVSWYKKLLYFGLPVGLAAGVSALHNRLDQILIFNLAGEQEAGIYGLAYRTASIILFVSSIINTVIIPRFASFNKKEFKVYFVKIISLVLVMGIFVILAIFLAPFLLPLLYGVSFKQAIGPFQLLMCGMFLSILASPFQSAILYKFKISYFSLINALISLLVVWFLLVKLIPQYNGIGVAIAVFIMMSVQLIVAVAYFWYLMKRYYGKVLN